MSFFSFKVNTVSFCVNTYIDTRVCIFTQTQVVVAAWPDLINGFVALSHSKCWRGNYEKHGIPCLALTLVMWAHCFVSSCWAFQRLHERCFQNNLNISALISAVFSVRANISFHVWCGNSVSCTTKWNISILKKQSLICSCPLVWGQLLLFTALHLWMTHCSFSAEPAVMKWQEQVASVCFICELKCHLHLCGCCVSVS